MTPSGVEANAQLQVPALQLLRVRVPVVVIVSLSTVFPKPPSVEVTFPEPKNL